VRAYLVAGLGFGDEGKGSVVDALVRRTGAELVVRYNGGCQAAHHVVLPNGRSHCFSQFGAGTLAGASTFLSRFVLVEPRAIEREAAHLRGLGIRDPYASLTVDPDAPVVTGYHRRANRARERARGRDRHGSCGLGIGELAGDVAAARGDVIRASDLHDWPVLREKMLALRDRKREELLASGLEWRTVEEEGWPTDWVREAGLLQGACGLLRVGRPELPAVAVFEGAQGVLLDEWHGFHPHTTWSDCTFQNAYRVIHDLGWGPALMSATRVGVTRAYGTRHGVGPFPAEAVGAPPPPGEHNAEGEWQGRFRVGALDLVLLRYALGVIGGVDAMAVTCLDHPARSYTTSYQYAGHDEEAVERDHHTHVVGLVPGSGLAWGERLRRVLEQSRPSLRAGDPAEVLRRALPDARRWIYSRGPAAGDKEFAGEWSADTDRHAA
jgi:adenylosuccinate synthase